MELEAGSKLFWVHLLEVVLWPEEVVAPGFQSMKLVLSSASLETFASSVFLSLLALSSLSLPSFSTEPAALPFAEVVFPLDQSVTSRETGTCDIYLPKHEGIL